MSRIDEIKKKLSDGIYEGNDFTNIADDVADLIYKLQIAEKALEKISVEMPGSISNESVLHKEKIAQEALQQIRN